MLLKTKLACIHAVWSSYEVKTEGDAFMIAFHTPTDAVKFAMKAQLQLFKQKWPAKISSFEACKQEDGSDGKVVFKGMRVRMGIHTGHPRYISWG